MFNYIFYTNEKRKLLYVKLCYPIYYNSRYKLDILYIMVYVVSYNLERSIGQQGSL